MNFLQMYCYNISSKQIQFKETLFCESAMLERFFFQTGSHNSCLRLSCACILLSVIELVKISFNLQIAHFLWLHWESEDVCHHHSSSLSVSGLLKLWVTTPFGVAKYNFGVAKQIGLTNQI